MFKLTKIAKRIKPNLRIYLLGLPVSIMDDILGGLRVVQMFSVDPVLLNVGAVLLCLSKLIVFNKFNKCKWSVNQYIPMSFQSIIHC